MILVDTSVWVNHLRECNPKLEALLLEADVVCHPFVIGELACGNIKNRKEILSLLQAMPSCPTVTQDEFLHFVETHNLMSKGIGFVDVHLLAAAKLSGLQLWTEDKNLKKVARLLKLSSA